MRRILAFSLAHIFLFAVFAAAQVQTGSILVRALDDQGAVVPGATIAITSQHSSSGDQWHDRHQRRLSHSRVSPPAPIP